MLRRVWAFIWRPRSGFLAMLAVALIGLTVDRVWSSPSTTTTTTPPTTVEPRPPAPTTTQHWPSNLEDCADELLDSGLHLVQVESLRRDDRRSETRDLLDDSHHLCFVDPERRGADSEFGIVVLDERFTNADTAVAAACRVSSELYESIGEIDAVRQSAVGIRYAASQASSETTYVAARDQQCESAGARAIADPSDFVASYYDRVGNAHDVEDLEVWLSADFLGRQSMEQIRSYWREEVHSVRTVSIVTTAEADLAAEVLTRMCFDDEEMENRPVSLTVTLTKAQGYWQIDSAAEEEPRSDQCR